MSAPAVTVRLATEADRAAVIDLFQDLDRHYANGRVPDPDAVTAERVGRYVYGEHSTEIALAEIDGRAVGLASFGMLFPGQALTGHLQLKDLYVRDGARGQGGGEALLRFLARLARERGCTRLDWTTETWNEGAQRLYDRIGAARLPQKIYYRLEGGALDRVARGE
ncbi:GNAT family N-acetyltransferase [Inquilinus limosus]|uniref:GNAT family N-acetyltransferase n=1 Tax=Inquilinus limosus TaxID=171674 RepID=UPI0004264CA7|nr:GNAT family N-acetyltransferase [Inquilinus limosus]